jgi:flagellar hook-associated protein 3 FlgL
MRIDSATYQSMSLAGIQSNQSSIARLSQQISTGLRMQTAKDDPIGSTKALELSNRIAIRTQYAENQTKAENDLSYQNVVLDEMRGALDQARSLFLSVSSSQSSAVQSGYAEQLKGVFNRLLDMANTQDTGGDYIFGGTASNVKPFTNSSVNSLSGATATVEATLFDNEVAPGPAALSATRQLEIGAGHLVQVTDSIVNVMRFNDASLTDPATDSEDHDVLQNLAHAMVSLQEGTMTEDKLRGYIGVIAGAKDNLLAIQQRVAGAQTEIKDLRASTQSILLLEKNALSDLTQVDQAAAIVELKSRQTTLEAVSRAYAMTSNLSLFNYIS